LTLKEEKINELLKDLEIKVLEIKQLEIDIEKANKGFQEIE